MMVTDNKNKYNASSINKQISDFVKTIILNYIYIY